MLPQSREQLAAEHSDVNLKKEITQLEDTGPGREPDQGESVKPSQPEVIYKDGKFTPAQITLQGSNPGSNCLLSILNRSSSTLTIRLSPPGKGDNWGPQYEVVFPGKELLIDPRFRIPEIAFYNKEKPSEEFSVKLAGGCGL